jgi:hypothetical protein
MKIKLLLGVLCLCVSANAWIYHPAYFARLDFENAYIYPACDTYEGLLESNGYDLDNESAGMSHLPMLVTTPVYAGTTALRIDVLPSDETFDQNVYQHHSGLPFYYNSYTAFMLYVPEDVPDPASWQMIYQWRQTSSNSPPMSLDFMPNGNYSLVLRNDIDGYEQIYTAALPRGQWVKFLVQHYFGLSGNGYVKLWVDDVFKVDYTGTIGWYSSQGDYDVDGRFGIYRGGTSKWCTMYFDEVRIGTSYSQVKIP